MLCNQTAEPPKTPHSLASDLVLHCLSMPHKMDAMVICVKINKAPNVHICHILCCSIINYAEIQIYLVFIDIWPS